MKRKNVHLTDEQWAKLEDEHQRTGILVAELIRRAVDLYLSQDVEVEPMGNYKTEATVKLDNAQLYFLRIRYKKRKDISADKLVKLAVLEIVGMQAQKELDESGYDVATKAALGALAEGAGEGGEG